MSEFKRLTNDEISLLSKEEQAEYLEELGKEEMKSLRNVLDSDDGLGKDEEQLTFTRPARAYTLEEVAQTFGGAIDTSQKSAERRLRAQRAGFRRRIERAFDLYVGFTAAQAAHEIRANPKVVQSYLETESTLPGSTIKRMDERTFVIINPFAG
jgi:hypothetical protein